MLEKARSEGIEVRGPVDMGSSGQSTCGDPNGYVVELTAPVREEIMYPAISKPHEVLAGWQAAKDGRGHGHDGAPVLKLLALPGALTTLRLCQALNPPDWPRRQHEHLVARCRQCPRGGHGRRAWSARPLAAESVQPAVHSEPRTYITERTCRPMRGDDLW